MRIGVECGGTFTDLMLLGEDGELRGTAKVFGTPDDPSRAVLAALDELLATVPEAGAASTLLHGSTVATNAVLERNGPRVGLLVTEGFKDVLSLARHDRDSTFDLHYRKPEPLVRRAFVREVPERLVYDGSELAAVNLEQVRLAVLELLEHGIQALAVSLLHSYASDVHERQVKELVGWLAPDLPVSLSSEVACEFREYERTSTTTVDAFIRPTMAGYVRRLAESVASRGLHDVAMMQSGGGVAPLALVENRPLQVLLSGPAAGVAGAVATARNAGIEDIVTLDMGGTSADVCLVIGGEPARVTETRIDRLPIRLPMVDIATVGAGGGSVVAVDSGGMLRVGPASAGADPGPACYGRGGTTPTVTDANVARGLIRTGHFAVAGLRTNDAAAWDALRPVADALGRPVEQLAEDVFRIANVTMAGAIRLVSVERGIDPRNYCLVAYGGAGPLHAAAVADEMRMSRVLVPASAGLQSAYGLLAANFRHEVATTELHDLATLSPATFGRILTELRDKAEAELKNLGEQPEGMTAQYAIDMRYVGQGFELTVPWPSLPTGDTDSLAWLGDAFHEAHANRYGHANHDKPVQIVTHRLVLSRPRGLREAPCTAAAGPAHVESAEILLDGHRTPCRFLWRESLPRGYTCRGPAVVEEATTTTFVPSGWSLLVDEGTSLLLRKDVGA